MITFDLHKKLKAPTGNLELNVNAAMGKGQFTSIYGHSGAGKTSILRMLAGLMKPDSGRIEVDGEIWFDSNEKINLPPQKRKIGFVFQDYALFPNMSVMGNLKFAANKNQNSTIIDEIIEVMELGGLINRNPLVLSGGQQQRVALARALIRKPQLLLLDEPLSALDNEMRIKMQDYILNVHQNYDLNTILVSHQLSEVIKMSDYIVILENGKVIKEGKASDIFSPNDLILEPKVEFDIIERMVEAGKNYVVILINDALHKIEVADESMIKKGKIDLQVKKI